MKFMNDYDIASARARFTRSNTPNRLALVLVIENLAEQTDTVSDGWAYWAKPCRSATKAIALVESTTNAANGAQERGDISRGEMTAAVAPIKAMLTRESRVFSAEQREIILRSVTS